MKCSPICFKCRDASCINVPEDIKNRPNLDDDLIISDGEAVEELLYEDATTTLNKNSFAAHLTKRCQSAMLRFFLLKTANL
ncbi:hypothetical protein AVEN_263593-1 [Araneus ventricosus]|uniref:Uncharacterized protein n=1 Tax=Araneus ventricosus TaxID=182803 RepID=A0A4Y2HZX5_ARAVE|nr:hypothetical protein AVEN_263593-1 [Araneus ventricosus]